MLVADAEGIVITGYFRSGAPFPAIAIQKVASAVTEFNNACASLSFDDGPVARAVVQILYDSASRAISVEERVYQQIAAALSGAWRSNWLDEVWLDEVNLVQTHLERGAGGVVLAEGEIVLSTPLSEAVAVQRLKTLFPAISGTLLGRFLSFRDDEVKFLQSDNVRVLRLYCRYF